MNEETANQSEAWDRGADAVLDLFELTPKLTPEERAALRPQVMVFLVMIAKVILRVRERAAAA